MADLFSRVKNKLDRVVFDRVLAEKIYPKYFELNPSRSPGPPSRDAVKSILVWNFDSLGDSLWITPVLKALRAGYPGAKITLACNRICEEIFATNPNVDLLFPVHAQPFYTGRGFLKAPPVTGSYDLMVILEMGSRPADRGRIFGRQAGIPYVISSDLGVLKTASHYKLPPNDGTEYWPEYFQRACDHLGIPRVPSNLEVFTTKDDTASVEKLTAHWSEDVWVGFHPGVAAYARLTKRWPPDHFALLSELLEARGSVRFVLTGSDDEREECDELAAEIRHRKPNAQVSVTSGLLKFRAMSELLRRLNVFVTGDTATMHLAAASQTPTVALFGATNPRTIAPPSVRAVHTDISCRPCHVTRDTEPFWPTCIYSEPKCLTSIAPSRVAQEVNAILRETKAKRRAT